MAQRHTKVLIVGSGPAGYTAAIYTARAMLKPLMISGIQPGGQLTITTEVENYPGFAEPIQGPWLMDQMKAQAEACGTEIIFDHIGKVDLSARPFHLESDGGDVYTCDSLIIATGAQAQWLGLPSEQKFQGFGVSACATCDGFFFRDKNVVVVGGGNSAVEEALYLAGIARHVTVIHRRDSFRSEKVLQDRLFKHEKISVVWDSVVDEICGSEKPLSVTHINVRNVKTNAVHTVEADGVFIAIGHKPQTAMFEGQLDMKSGGYLKTAPDSTATNIPGVFAAGDVSDDVFRQAVTAAGMGCMAALETERYLATLEQ